MSFPYFASLGIFLSLVPQATADGPFFMGLGHLEGYDYESYGRAISGDGTVVVGSSCTQSEGSMAFRWTIEEGMVPLGFLPGGDTSGAYGVSAEGSVIVGFGTSYNTTEEGHRQAFRWTAATGMVGLDDLQGGSFHSRAYGVTADGQTVVGYGTKSEVVDVRHAVRWTDGGAPEDLGGMPDVYPALSTSHATAISADGSVIAGWARNLSDDQEACIWTEGEGIVGMGSLGGYGSDSLAWDVAVSNEAVVVGVNTYYGGDNEAFRWTSETGMVGLGDLPGGLNSSQAYAVSADGNVIVGSGCDEIGGMAMIWDEQNGMRDLKTVLETDYGLDLSEWYTLTAAKGISDDSRTIVGFGFHNNVREAWVAHIPEPTTGMTFLVGGILVLSRRRIAKVRTF
jgi:probable HAF family extracellular repeat protein